jgi:hypothetical protein
MARNRTQETTGPRILQQPQPRRRFLPTSNQVIACCAVFALAVSVITFISQKASDRGLQELAASVKSIHDLQYAPQPTVEGPFSEVSIGGPLHLIEAANLKIRNLGRGTCLDLSARVLYTDSGASKRPDGHIADSDVERPPIPPFTVLDHVTLAAGESKPFEVTQHPMYKTPFPQWFQGVIEINCRDESGARHHFMQRFIVTVHLENNNPHAHFHFHSPWPVTASSDVPPIVRSALGN